MSGSFLYTPAWGGESYLFPRQDDPMRNMTAPSADVPALGSNFDTPAEKGERFVEIIVLVFSVIVVAIPEGLPLAVTLALAFATTRMTKMKLLVRNLSACETMANATVICTDKTGTLTQNEMSVVAGSVGAHLKFAYNLKDHQERVITSGGAGDEGDANRKTSIEVRSGRRDWAIDQQELSTVIHGDLRTLFNDAIAVNSTAFEEEQSDAQAAETSTRKKTYLERILSSFSGKTKKSQAAADAAQQDEKAAAAPSSSLAFVGSKTETALLKMAKELGWEDYRSARERNSEIVQMIPFSSERKSMGVVVKLRQGGYRLYAKGASEVLSKLCSKHIEVAQPPVSADGQPAEDISASGEIREVDFTEETRDNIAKTIIFYANQTLRTIAITYRDFEQWPPAGAKFAEKHEGDDEEDGSSSSKKAEKELEVDYDWLARDMTLIAITGIEDPLRPGVKNAVGDCGKAGVQVKMCTGDNVLTARSIATQCGIYTAGGIIMEGPVFRKLSDADMNDIVPRLQVLARSSPEDKKILVSKLKAMGEVVGVTGDGTNDGPALKTANVGFSMGIAGTEVAKEASDIILMDDNFASIVSAIMWGRCVNDAVRKFLQFQLSVNIVAVIVTFVTAVASEEEESALTPVQLLWINLIMDTLAALALATDPAHPSLLDRKPDKSTAPLISIDMWKMIIGQSIYQLIVVLVLHFAGPSLFNHIKNPVTPQELAISNVQHVELAALVFNAFVWCQLFSQVNSRVLDRKLNIFDGIHRNPWFSGILLIEIAAQVLIVFVGGRAFSVTRLKGRDWAISIVAGAISLPVGAIIRLIPTKPILDFAVQWKLISDPDSLPAVPPPKSEEAEKDHVTMAKGYEATAIGDVAERLSAFAMIRGGRSRALGLSFKSKARRMREADVHPQSLLALVPALIGAGIGSGWRPSNPKEANIKDPAAGEPTPDSLELYQGNKLQFHPDTKDDPFYERLKAGRRS